MAETKGINIAFRGETAQFESAVKTVNGDIKKTKSEISLLNKELKFDPKNVEALGKKFDLIRQKEKQLTEYTQVLKAGLEELDPQTKEWDNFNRQLQKAQYELNAVRKEIENMPTAEIAIASKNLEEWGNKLQNVGNKLESVGKKLSIVSAGIVGLGTAGIKYNAQLEQFQTAYTTLIGDAEKANEALSKIQQGASLTPFSTESLIEANQYLISAGVEADEAYKMIMNLGDAISATGGGSAELARMAQNLQQIKNLGKASSVDIKQFANAGINIYGLLAETTGKTVEQLKEMDITYEQLRKAFEVASSEGGKYFGAMENQSQTLNGSISTLKDTFSQLLGKLTESLVPVVKDVIKFMQDLVKTVKEMSPEQKAMITRIAEIIALIGPALAVGGKIINLIGGITTKIGGLLANEKVATLIAKLTANGTSLGNVLKTIFTFVKGFINPITIIIGILGVLYASNEEIRNQINTLVQSLIGLLKPTIELIINILKIVWSIIQEVVNIIIIMWQEFAKSEAGKKFIDIVKQIISWVQTAIDWISKLIGWLVDATNWFLNLIGVAKDFNNVSVGNGGGYGGNSSAVINSGGIGIGSGGIGLTANIHINNNGKPIDDNEVKRWVSVMANQLDIELGRRF